MKKSRSRAASAPDGARERPANRATFVVQTTDTGTRLDVFLVRHLPDLSRSQVQRLVHDGLVTVDGRHIKGGVTVTAGQTVDAVIPAAEPDTAQPEALPLSVLHEDADIIVINKPAGMVVHPSAGHASGTLVNALLHHATNLSGIGGKERPGIVHRLDRGTSGVMVIAKNDRAHRELSRQFHDRTVVKQYVALVWGTLSPSQVLDTPIGRHPRHRLKMSSRASKGRAASTTVLTVEPRKGVSLITVRIGTGRTHQIRVHLSEAGHAVVGDELYGGTRKRLPPTLTALGRLERPFLHAATLQFTHPTTGQPMSFSAPLPDDLAATWNALAPHV